MKCEFKRVKCKRVTIQNKNFYTKKSWSMIGWQKLVISDELSLLFFNDFLVTILKTQHKESVNPINTCCLFLSLMMLLFLQLWKAIKSVMLSNVFQKTKQSYRIDSRSKLPQVTYIFTLKIISQTNLLPIAALRFSGN